MSIKYFIKILRKFISTTNQTARVLELIKRFNNGQKISIEALLNEDLWFGKSEKTIRRDLDVIKEYFPDSYELVKGGEKSCYKAITKNAFDNFINAEFMSLIVQMFNLANKSDLFNKFRIKNKRFKKML